MGTISEHGLGQMKPTPGKTPAPKRTVLPAPTKPKRVSLNPMQQAQLNVRRLLAPQYAEASQEAARQNQAIQAYTTAVMQQLAGMAPAIQNDYNNAISSQRGLVDAAASSLRSVNPSGDVAKLLDAVGAPQAQTSQIQGNLNNTFNGGAAVGQYVNGVLPLGALRSQGEAATSLARLQPSFQALAGRQALASALADQSDLRAKIAAQAPGMIQDQLNTFSSNAMKRQQLDLEARAAGLKQANTDRSFNLSVAKVKAAQAKDIRDYNLRVSEFNAKQSADAAKAAAANPSQSRLRGYLADSNGKAILDANGKKQPITGYKLTAKGQVVKTYKPTTSELKTLKPFGDLTKTQVSTLRATANELRFGTTYTGKNPAVVNGKTYQPGDRIPPFSYGQAIRFLVAKGFSRRNAIAMLNNFYPPRMRGKKAQVKAYYGGTLPDVNPATNPNAAGPVRP